MPPPPGCLEDDAVGDPWEDAAPLRGYSENDAAINRDSARSDSAAKGNKEHPIFKTMFFWKNVFFRTKDILYSVRNARRVPFPLGFSERSSESAGNNDLQSRSANGSSEESAVYLAESSMSISNLFRIKALWENDYVATALQFTIGF